MASYQHPYGAAINWSQVRASGQTFVFIKASEGSYYDNPYFAADAAAARAAGLIVGAYHFARPGGDAGAAAQARHLVSVAGLVRNDGTLPLVLDLEDSGGLSPTALRAWTYAFLSTAQALTGRTPLLYTYVSFWRNQLANDPGFAQFPLWEARYASHYDQIGGWKAPTFWQYTDAAGIPGIAGGVDRSWYLGSSATLTALARGSIAPAATQSRTHPGPLFRAAGRLLDGALAVSFAGATDTGGYRITSYQAQLLSPGGGVRTFTLGRYGRSLQLSGLTTSVTYGVRIRALNAAGGAVWTTLPLPSMVSVRTGITASSRTVSQAHRTTLTVTMTVGAGRVPAVARYVVVYRSEAGGSWVRIATLRLGSGGSARLPVTVAKNSRYLVRAVTGRYEQHSQSVTSVGCVPSVRLVGPSRGYAGHALPFTVISSAREQVGLAALQVWVGTSWHTVSYRRLSAVNGQLRGTISYVSNVRGTLRLRVIEIRDRAYLAVASPAVLVRVT